ncbi:MAG: host attachment protein [Proteobacteria bacterium]|jgi:protein required for attachment to host cells|nr:host attachment protein [Pseudomonadota bacterium]
MSIKVMVSDTVHLHIYSMAKARAKLEKIATFANPFAIKHERDGGADKPGRGMSRAAGRRTALEGRTTLKQHAADQFARMVAKTASAAARDSDTTGIVLIMTPRLMSMVDEHLPKTAAKKITARIKRDLVDVPRLELQRRVNASLMP